MLRVVRVVAGLGRPRGLRAARGGVLLEVMLSFGLLVTLGVSLMTLFRSGVLTSRELEARLRCAQLAAMKLAEFDTHGVKISDLQIEEARFTSAPEAQDPYRNFRWSARAVVAEVIENAPEHLTLYNLTITVVWREADQETRYVLSTLRPGSYSFNLETDAGVTAEQAGALAGEMPLLPSLQTGNLDLADLQSLDPVLLAEILPRLMQMFGAGGLSGGMPDLEQLRRQLQEAGVNPGDLPGLPGGGAGAGGGGR